MGRDPREVPAAELADGTGFAYARVQSYASRAFPYCLALCYLSLTATLHVCLHFRLRGVEVRASCFVGGGECCNVLIIQGLARLGSDNKYYVNY